ncbi:MAG: lamin tail domain-containing protein, partial [Bacteroidota bacterium]
MKICHLFLFALVFPLRLAAQFHDDFSDGDLTNNPTWQGDLSHFQVNANFECQLNAPAAGASSLFAPIFLQDSATWEFFFRLEFDPSAANRLRIYLQSDALNLPSGNGYFLSIGEDGGDDAVKFYRQDGGNETLLGTATTGAVATSPAVRMQVKKDALGTWTLAADYSGGSNFSQEMQVQDATWLWGAWFFGFQCQYTATRKDKFFFDDVTAPLAPDTQAPAALSAEAVSATEVDVIFNEPLDPATISAVQNYQVSNGVGEPSEAILDVADATLIHLTLAMPLTSGENYSLTISGFADLSGNLSQPQTLPFSFFEIEPAAEFDLLINEIMADPSPPVALPEVEFLEIFNRSGKVIDLAGFQLSSGGVPQIFPSHLLQPGKFVLVCDDSDVDSLAVFGETIGLPTFPALSNAGDEITLADPSGKVIHHLEFALDWYKNTTKNDGGWTLELINPLAPCEGESNWRASENLLGGTPGQSNSVLDEQPDEKSPDLVRVFASAAQPAEIQLFFSENLDRVKAENAANYQISGGVNVESES